MRIHSVAAPAPLNADPAAARGEEPGKGGGRPDFLAIMDKANANVASRVQRSSCGADGKADKTTHRNSMPNRRGAHDTPNANAKALGRGPISRDDAPACDRLAGKSSHERERAIGDSEEPAPEDHTQKIPDAPSVSARVPDPDERASGKAGPNVSGAGAPHPASSEPLAELTSSAIGPGDCGLRGAPPNLRAGEASANANTPRNLNLPSAREDGTPVGTTQTGSTATGDATHPSEAGLSPLTENPDARMQKTPIAMDPNLPLSNDDPVSSSARPHLRVTDQASVNGQAATHSGAVSVAGARPFDPKSEEATATSVHARIPLNDLPAASSPGLSATGPGTFPMGDSLGSISSNGALMPGLPISQAGVSSSFPQNGQAPAGRDVASSLAGQNSKGGKITPEMTDDAVVPPGTENPVYSVSRLEPLDKLEGISHSAWGTAAKQPVVPDESWKPATQRTQDEAAQSAAGMSGPAAAGTAESELVSGRILSAQIRQDKDPAQVAAESGMERKPTTIREASLLQHSTAGGLPVGEAHTPAQARPSFAPSQRIPEFILQVADRIQLQIHGVEGQIRIQLKPEFLGQMEIKAESGVGGITARIATESIRVREYLENNLPVLQQALQDQGLKVDRIEVVLHDTFDARQTAAQHQAFDQAGRGEGDGNPRSSSETLTSGSVSGPDGFGSESMPWLSLGPNSTFHTIA